MQRGTVRSLQRLFVQPVWSTSFQPTSRLFSSFLLGNLNNCGRSSSILSFSPPSSSSASSSIGQLNSSLILVRGFKNPKTKQKSRRTAVKRFIETGNGKLKRAHSGKSHLTGHMCQVRKVRLNNRVIMEGTNLKNVSKLIL